MRLSPTPGAGAADSASAVAPGTTESLTVAVVSIAGERLLERCLIALRRQTNAPQFDIVVAASDHLGALPRIRREFPEVRIFMHPGVRTPIELAAIAMREAQGALILLTEDHCVPDAGWVCSLANSVSSMCGAVGGAIEPLGEMTPFEWAFYFVDFHRYPETLNEGPIDSLSVCNVAYQRSDLDRIDEDWRSSFHETRVHLALARRVGPLWMEPRARVRTRRRVGRDAALRERHAFGRIYACKRIYGQPVLRVWLAIVSPMLPILLMIQLVRGAVRRRSFRLFLRAFPDLLALVGAWSGGEVLGYVTAKMPTSGEAARELDEPPPAIETSAIH